MTWSLLAVGLVMAAMMVASRALARRTGLPYPVFLVIAGSAMAFVPNVHAVHLEPRIVFLGFLPPLVYHAGIVTSPRELRANALPIALGAFGLVLATTFAVAGATRWAYPALGWTGAFVLGAVVAPTDPVAATSVLDRLGGPPKLTTILEGESLVNDGVALSLFTLGLAAVASPTGVGSGTVTFIKLAGGGTAFGLALGWVISRLRRPLRDPSSEIVVSLLVPFVAYLPADSLGLSGVLSTLATGLVLGQQGLGRLEPSGRIRVNEFWQVLVFLLESALFVLMGLQLRYIVDGIPAGSLVDAGVVAGVAVCAVVTVRLLWWLAVPTLRWRPEGRILDTGAVPLRERVILGWSGLRGAISLAAALSIPTLVSGKPFHSRNIIVFSTICVIGATLVGQGVSLPWLLRRMGLAGSDVQRRQHALAERRCAEAALRRLDELVASEDVTDSVAEGLREMYERRLTRIRDRLDELDDDKVQKSRTSLGALHDELLARQHATLARLHRDGEISFAVMRQVRTELDLEHAGRHVT